PSNNAMGGTFTYAQNASVHESVYIGDSSAFKNSGKAGLLFNSGNGITMSSVNGGTIERPVAHDNVSLSDAGNGPIGIWAFNSTRVTLQFNESYHNLTGGEKDGGGFCFDLNTSQSVMQYNYSHDNTGAGYQLAHKADTFAHTGNVIRYNVTENDGRNHDYAGIQTWGRILNAEIYNNTIYMAARPAGSLGVPRGIFIKNSSIPLQDPQHLHFRNNIIQTTGSVRLIEAQPSALDAAVDLRAQGVDPGMRDYYGGITPVNGLFDIGAHEYRVSCNWGISPASASASATETSTGTIAVTAADIDCGWAAQSTVDWMGVWQ